MPEREVPQKPKPDILTKPFVKGLHPYTMMFLFLAYEEGAHERLNDDLQRNLFDLYFTGELTIAGQDNPMGRTNLEKEITAGFAILRLNVSDELNNIFTEKQLPYFKESDLDYVSNPQIERKKLRFAKQSIGRLLGTEEFEDTKKRGEIMRKRWDNQDYRKTQIKKKTGRKLSEETKKKIRKARAKQVFSQETRDKMSQKRKGMVMPLETRTKISDSLKGRKRSAETKKNMSEAAIKRERNKRISKEVTSF